jgi:hypothetical protein
VFYNRCAEDIAHASAARLCPEPNLPTLQRVSQPRAEWPPRAYIECLQDRAISPDYQRGMHLRAGVPRVLSLDADHSPFLSAPTELADMLGMLAGELVKPGTGEESTS